MNENLATLLIVAITIIGVLGLIIGAFIGDRLSEIRDELSWEKTKEGLAAQ